MASKLLHEVTKWFRAEASEEAKAPPTSHEPAGEEPARPAAAVSRPLAFVVDDEEGICKFVSMGLGSLGIEAPSFQTAARAIEALNTRIPALIFLDIALKGSDAVDVLRELGRKKFSGVVQLMSGSNQDLLEDVRRIGTRHGLTMNAPLEKPFRMEAIRRVLAEAKLGGRESETVILQDALAQDWLELWYSPRSICAG